MAAKQTRGREKRAAIVKAAADIAREQGFAAVRHRAVAARAEVPLGSTTYYFSSLDELLGAVADLLYDECLTRGAAVLEAADPGPYSTPEAAGVITSAILPSDDAGHILTYYEQLLGAARHPAVAQAWRSARPRLEQVVRDAMALAQCSDVASPGVLLAVVDGAVISALSEGRHDILRFASGLVAELLTP